MAQGIKFETEEERILARRESNRKSAEKKRRESGVKPRTVFHSEEERRNAKNEASRKCNEKKRRESGIAPRKIYSSDEERREAHNISSKKWRDNNPKYLEEYYNSNEGRKELNRINVRDKNRVNRMAKRAGIDISGLELHHLVYHADDNFEDWYKDCMLSTVDEHKKWHMDHPEWIATIV